MDPLTLRVHGTDDAAIECWDDDGDLQCVDDIQFRSVSTATSVTNSSVRRSGHRDSISSRRSARSDVDLNAGNDEGWQVLLHENDDVVNEEAISSARNAGIPIPANIPKSALLGGTIKRLGRRKTKKELIDDWSEDVGLPSPDCLLELKRLPEGFFPDSLAQLGSADDNHVRSFGSSWEGQSSSPLQMQPSSLDGSREQLGELEADTAPNINVSKSRMPHSGSAPTGSLEYREKREDVDDFENDFDLPRHNLSLQLSARKEGPASSSSVTEDFDIDLLEGSIGVRFGGTHRDRPSNPSSSISVMSPSGSSCLTGEGEEDRLDGLVIPDGPLDLEKALKQRQGATEPLADSKEHSSVKDPFDAEGDFLAGIEIEDGDPFMGERLSVNPNIKRKAQPPGSPSRRAATSITFTNTNTATNISPKTRIPRPSGHSRPHSTQLETVAESGAPLVKFMRPQSRLSAHVSNPSTSSCPPSAIPMTPPSPGRRLAGTRALKDLLQNDPNSSGTILKSKRSMPKIENSQGSTWSQPFHRPLSRPDATYGPSLSSRPKTPIERTGNDFRSLCRRTPRPYSSAGTSSSPSHVSNKSFHHSRRTNSDTAHELFSQGHIPRLSRFSRSEPLGRSSRDTRAETFASSSRPTLTRPTKRRHFGDGTELELFDDLPTSASVESRFIKPPTGRGVPRSFRSRISQNQSILRTETPTQPATSATTSKPQETPRFARDTAASRNAREQRIASMTMSSKNRDSNTLASLGSNRKPQVTSRVPSSGASLALKRARSNTPSRARPQLIKPLGTGMHEAKSINGMHYNPAACVWEGNENSVSEFDVVSPRSPKPSPALITNVGGMQNVQIVGEMVFDPKRMCWLKLAPTQPGSSHIVAMVEDDVFAGLDDLEDKPQRAVSAASGLRSSGGEDFGAPASGDDPSGDSYDEWPITEEFDVGPEFIKRQRAEEEKWKRKVDKWVNFDRGRLGDGWRWAIRELVKSHEAFGSERVSSP